MKKLLLLVGAALGFVLGSKMGRQPYERLEAQVRRVAGRPEVQGAMDSAAEKAADLAHTVGGAVSTKIADVTDAAGTSKGPTGAIDQAEIDAETEAALDQELKDTFPTSDAPSSWAGPDLEPERPDSGSSQ